MKIRIPTLNTVLVGASASAVLLGIVAAIWFFHGPTIKITGPTIQGTVSSLTGLPCDEPARRPLAVMIASDPQARPLSGIAEADMVFEMPVTPNGITRMMAIYQCGQEPKEVGSIRSARQDFIPLAQGMKAELAHWGGEHGALEELNNHIIDNIDALIYEGTVFYRKNNIPRPHNGFSTLELLRTQATKLGYSTRTEPIGYLHESVRPSVNMGALVDRVSVSWPQSMDVEYRYDRETNTYARWRGGTAEIDTTTGQQVTASVVVVMHTTSAFLRDQYITVHTVGQGEMELYQDGQRLSGHWSKENAQSMLQFTDDAGHPIALAPGHIWVEIDAPLPAVQ